MSPFPRLAGLLLASTLLGGCASQWQDMFVSYSNQMVPLRNQLLLGHAAEALPRCVNPPGGRHLCAGPAGAGAHRLAGRAGCGQQAGLCRRRQPPRVGRQSGRVSAEPGPESGGSLLTNDQSMAYLTPDYERTMLHHYLALNYLQRGDADGALVEVRRANQVQERALKARAGR